jgi:hypothetical protein
MVGVEATWVGWVRPQEGLRRGLIREVAAVVKIGGLDRWRMTSLNDPESTGNCCEEEQTNEELEHRDSVSR